MKKIALCVLTTFYFLSVGYTTNQEFGADVKVTAVVNELPVEKIEVSYNGTARQGEKLNKDDFSVIPFSKWENGDKTVIVEGTRVNSNEFAIAPTSIEEESGTIRVTYKNVYYDIVINCVNKGQLKIMTDGLTAKLTVAAIKQKEDDNILNKGKDITYTIQSEEKKEPISENLEEAIQTQKNILKSVEVLKAYDINIKKEVKGESSTTVSKTNEDIYLTLGIPVEYRKDGKTYYMMHEHNGNIELLRDLDNDIDTITIQTSSFSSYVLYWVDTAELISKDKTPKTEENKISDNEDPDNICDNNNKLANKEGSASVNQIPNHPHDNIIIEVTATCEECGYRDVTCKICGSHEQRKTSDALGHLWQTEDETEEITVQKCVRCGILKQQQKENSNNVAPPLGESDKGKKAINIDLEKSIRENLKNKEAYDSTGKTSITWEKPENDETTTNKQYIEVHENNPVDMAMQQKGKRAWLYWVIGILILLLLLLLFLYIYLRRKKQKFIM